MFPFVDDTSVFGCFELITCLKVNFWKLTVVGVGVDLGFVSSIVEVFGCQVESFPIWYLSLPLFGV